MAYRPLYELLDEAADWIKAAETRSAEIKRALTVELLDDDESVPDLAYWLDEYTMRLVQDLENKANRHRELWENLNGEKEE